MWGTGRPSPLNEGRSLNSGDTAESTYKDVRVAALNEGRSLNSGDTPRIGHGGGSAEVRSTKAGV